MSKKKHNRRKFFKIAGIGALLGSVALWNKLVGTERKLLENRTIIIPFDQNKNISFHPDFIIVNEDNHTRVFSSQCTHLGCVINQSKDAQLLCPCHGSTFDKNGSPLKGPAIKSLKELAFEIDQNSQQITISL